MRRRAKALRLLASKPPSSFAGRQFEERWGRCPCAERVPHPLARVQRASLALPAPSSPRHDTVQSRVHLLRVRASISNNRSRLRISEIDPLE